MDFLDLAVLRFGLVGGGAIVVVAVALDGFFCVDNTPCLEDEPEEEEEEDLVKKDCNVDCRVDLLLRLLLDAAVSFVGFINCFGFVEAVIVFVLVFFFVLFFE